MDRQYVREFLRSAFRDLHEMEDGCWVAGGHEGVSFGEELHDENAAFDDLSFWFKQRNQVFRGLLKRFEAQPPLVDIGGGTGIVGRFLNDGGFPTINLEPTRSGASRAVQRGVPTVVSTLQNAGAKAGMFSSVGMFDVLEHIEQEQDALTSIHEILRPGGHLFISVPAHEWLWSSEDRVAGHHRRYTQASLRRSLESASLEPIFMTHIFSYLTAPLLMLRSVPTLWGRSELKRPENKHAIHVPSKLLGHFVDRMGRLEMDWLETGHTIPFGTSVIAVAHKRRA